MNQFSPNTQVSIFPPAIKALLLWNVIVFLATINIFAGGWTPIGDIVKSYMVLQPFGYGFRPWQLITYLFLHANFAHLLFNMYALWFFGQSLENLWGTKRFIIYYFLTGIGAGLLHLVTSGSLALGASGAVFGVLLGAGMMFPNNYVLLIIPPIPIKVKYLVAIFGIFELYSGVMSVNSGVAHFAHVGGLVVGFILIKLWKLKKAEY